MKQRAVGSNSERMEGNGHEYTDIRAHLQSIPHPPRIHAWQTPYQHLLDVELSLGVATRHRGDGKPLLHDDRSPHSAVAELRENGMERSAISAGDCRHA